MMKQMTRWVSVTALTLFGVYNRVFAKTGGAEGTGGTGGTGGSGGGVPIDLGSVDPLAGKGFQDVVTAVANGLVMIAVPIVGIMVIVGAFQIMTAGGNTEKVESGKKTIWYAVIGFAVVLVASSVVLIIKDLITK